MTDRELLELAAKAAGIVDFVWRDDRESMFHYNTKMMCWYRDSYGDLIEWNPLTDDGDALRLAVKLDLNVLSQIVRDSEGRLTIVTEEEEPDDYAATRRAIVRAAAEIGKEKP